MDPTRGVGFNGTAATTWVDDVPTMTGKSNAGVPCAVTSDKSETTAVKGISTVVESSGRRYSIGPTIHDRFEFASSASWHIAPATGGWGRNEAKPPADCVKGNEF